MRKTTARFVEWLLQLLLPASGRHRVAEIRPGFRCVDAPALRLARAPLAHAWAPHGADAPDTGLFRPYVVAHERERRRGAVGHGVKAVAL